MAPRVRARHSVTRGKESRAQKIRIVTANHHNNLESNNTFTMVSLWCCYNEANDGRPSLFPHMRVSSAFVWFSSHLYSRLSLSTRRGFSKKSIISIQQQRQDEHRRRRGRRSCFSSSLSDDSSSSSSAATTKKKKRVAIVGGGLAGLSTAFHLLNRTTNNNNGGDRHLPPPFEALTVFDTGPVGTGGASSVAGG